MLKCCAWCDRRMTDYHMPTGNAISTEEQRTMSHGICRHCLERVVIEWLVSQAKWMERVGSA